jgi:hypothetical protein
MKLKISILIIIIEKFNSSSSSSSAMGSVPCVVRESVCTHNTRVRRWTTTRLYRKSMCGMHFNVSVGEEDPAKKIEGEEDFNWQRSRKRNRSQIIKYENIHHHRVYENIKSTTSTRSFGVFSLFTSFCCNTHEDLRVVGLKLLIHSAPPSTICYFLRYGRSSHTAWSIFSLSLLFFLFLLVFAAVVLNSFDLCRLRCVCNNVAAAAAVVLAIYWLLGHISDSLV